MSRPRLLDLFCKAGGASTGYYRAGFDVVGVDIEPQKRFPGQGLFGMEGMSFVQADALEYVAAHGYEFDAITASPPCQFATQLGALHRSKGPGYDAVHPNLLPQTRAALQATGKPYVIENVQGAQKHMIDPVMLCGSMFGLQTDCGARLLRHRLFECNWLCLVPMRCRHGQKSIGATGTGQALSGEMTIGVHGCPQLIEGRRRTICVTGNTPWSGKIESPVITVVGHTAQTNVVKNQVRVTYTLQQAQVAMGIDWMTQSELSQAIPPSYTEFIGRQLMCFVED
jgi:DNA (cytosine-5)-methyltransferase 1